MFCRWSLAVCLIMNMCFAYAAIACCSLAPAHFGDTCGWVGELQKDGELIHAMAYWNSAINLNLAGTRGNAMILPIPAVPGTLTSENMLDGNDFKSIASAGPQLRDGPLDSFLEPRSFLYLFMLCVLLIAHSHPKRGVQFACWVVLVISLLMLLKWQGEPGTMGVGTRSGHATQRDVQVFNRGSYTVVLSTDAKKIPQALDQVPENKRPSINAEIFEAYDKWYPGWSFALCCFAKDLPDPEPLVWWYKPQDPARLFFPAVDAHTGHAPEMNTLVGVDHDIVVSSDRMFTGLANSWFSPVRTMPALFASSAAAFQPRFVMAKHFGHAMLQGDFIFRTSDVRMGILRPLRIRPPGIAHSTELSVADFASEDSSLLPKVVWGYFIAAVLLFLLNRRVIAYNLLWSCTALSAVAAFSAGINWSASNLDLFKAQHIFTLLLCILALSLPLLLIAQEPRQRWWFALMAVILIAIPLFLSGYSSAWFPFLWAIIICAATLKIPRPAALAPASSQ
jgi:hypothetical protein